MNNSLAVFYAPRKILAAAAVTILYLAGSYFLIGFKTDQLFLAGLFNLLYFFSGTSRKFILGFSIFIVYWILFDYMKAFPNYLFNEVHIRDLYNAEKLLFGLEDGGKIITPNEYWLQHHRTSLDILTGVFYLCWIPVPLAFAAYLFFRNRQDFLYFSITFVLVNMLGFIVYYIYPAAPPWYFQLNGDVFVSGTPGNTAGLGRFDQYFEAGIFRNLYAKSSNVFAAMPSLHSAYPVIVLYYGIRRREHLLVNLLFTVVMVGIWFAAVYTSHHYVLDVVAGILTACTGILLFKWMTGPRTAITRLLRQYQQLIS